MSSFGDSNLELVLGTGGTQGTLSVGTSAVEALAGASRLPGRQLLVISNTSSNTIYWGLSSAVTTSTGIPIPKNREPKFSINDQCGVWLIAGTAGNIVRVVEGA